MVGLHSVTPADSSTRPLSIKHTLGNVHLLSRLSWKCTTDSLYLPSIIKVLGLTSWQGVVTVIMLSGSLPCNQNDSFNTAPSCKHTLCKSTYFNMSSNRGSVVPYKRDHGAPLIKWSMLMDTSPTICHSVAVKNKDFIVSTVKHMQLLSFKKKTLHFLIFLLQKVLMVM